MYPTSFPNVTLFKGPEGYFCVETDPTSDYWLGIFYYLRHIAPSIDSVTFDQPPACKLAEFYGLEAQDVSQEFVVSIPEANTEFIIYGPEFLGIRKWAIKYVIAPLFRGIDP